ncbi:MAG: M28 family peptidase [bacterium]|nr:M28 family peptidase [bacterium]
MGILLFVVMLAIPRYLVIDVKRIGTEYIEKQGAKVIQRIDSITYLVEGELEKMDYSPYEIVLYETVEKKVKTPYTSGMYYIPDLPEVSDYFNMINVDSIFATLNRLEAFKTRYAYTDSCRKAEEYLTEKIQNYSDLGYMWPFEHNRYWMHNVVGVRNGVVSDFILITSHLDSYSDDRWNNAPGADDNGSGTAAVVECARVLKDLPSPFLSFQFVPFSAEELGLIGSYRYAQYIADNNLPLRGVLNFDMVGFNPQDGYDFDVNLDTLSLFGQVVMHVIKNYVQGNNRYSYTPSYGSDHYPFAEMGYPWTFLIESNYHSNPNYHRTTDLVSTLDTLQMLNATKLAVATALYYALLPLPPESLSVVNFGDGDRVVLRWPRVSADGVNYTIYKGTSPSNFVFVTEVSDTFVILEGQQTGTTYYYYVRSKYGGREGFGTPIKELRVDYLPQAPVLTRLQPKRDGIGLFWKKNTEEDVAGYNIYRSAGENFVKINDSLIADTSYDDISANLPIWYSYYITAVDSLGNESDPSNVLSARPVTLSEGILVIDDFRDGSGSSPIAPNGEMQRSFIDSILGSVGVDTFEVMDVAQVSSVSLSDIGIYSLVWVMSDDATELLGNRYRDALIEYLSSGGKVLIEGYKNSQNLGIVGSYPQSVDSSNLFGLRLDSVKLNTFTDFQGAYNSIIGLELHPEPSKLLPSWNGRLQNVEAYISSSVEPLLYFDSYSDNPDFEGELCAFKMGDSLVYIGFPLYYIRAQDVTDLFAHLADIGFVNVRERLSVNKVSAYYSGGYLFLDRVFDGAYGCIYNISGQKVRGIRFEGSRFYVGTLRRGVYFYEIQKGKNVYKGKFIVLR